MVWTFWLFKGIEQEIELESSQEEMREEKIKQTAVSSDGY